MKRALIVVDVQNDFCEGGSMGVTGGADVAGGIGALLGAWQDGGPQRAGVGYDHVVATRDHHVDPGDHWSAEPDFRDSWPVHCEVGTTGEEFHPALEPRPFEAVFLKGEREAAYSGFEGYADGVGLATWLREREVTEVDICGIATDYCVRATALDAAGEGFATRVLLDLCAGVAEETTAAAVAAMRDRGVDVG